MTGKSCLAGYSAALTGYFSSKIKDRPAACVSCSKLQQTTLGNKQSPMPQTLTIQTSVLRGPTLGQLLSGQRHLQCPLVFRKWLCCLQDRGLKMERKRVFKTLFLPLVWTNFFSGMHLNHRNGSFVLLDVTFIIHYPAKKPKKAIWLPTIIVHRTSNNSIMQLVLPSFCLVSQPMGLQRWTADQHTFQK